MELLRSIFPSRWFPPFRRGDWVQEEVIQTRIQKCGHYDQSQIPGIIECEFNDEMHDEHYKIRFADGHIWLIRK